MSETYRIFLLSWVVLSLALSCLSDDPNASGNQHEPSAQPKAPQLQNFFQSDHKPLSFSYFDQTPSASRASPQPVPTITRSVSRDEQGGTPFGFGASYGTTMDTVMQGIRDLKLTIAEMDDKLDRIVQKVVPGEGKSLMNKGADMFKKLLRLPTSDEANATRLERNLGMGGGGGGGGFGPSGIGLRRWH